MMEKRQVIGNAVRVAQIATGEAPDDNAELTKPKSNKVKSGRAGAKARNKSLSGEDRTLIARKAAKTRWK